MTDTTLLFRAEWGSRAYGLGTPQSDHDIIEVVIEPREAITGLETVKPSKHSSTAETGERSTSADTDYVTYSLKHYAHLTVEGNPQVISTLWLNNFTDLNPLFMYMQQYRQWFISKHSGYKYLGYMNSQIENLEGLTNKRTNRPELIHQYGYDVKFAMHAARLGLQGTELLKTGNIILPMTGGSRDLCLNIRRGYYDKSDCLEILYNLRNVLEDTIDNCDYPEYGDKGMMNDILHDIYSETWGGL